MPIQGTEADLMKLAMLAVEKRLTTMTSLDLLPSETGKFEKNEFALPERQVSSGSKSGLVHKNISLGHQILQIHDSIMVECSRQNAEIVKIGRAHV